MDQWGGFISFPSWFVASGRICCEAVKAQPAVSFREQAMLVATAGTESHKVQQPNVLLIPVRSLLSCAELSSPREEQFGV